MRKIAVGLMMSFLAFGVAQARDLDGRYANVDPKVKEWFNSLRDKRGVGCCDESDGSRIEDTEWRTSSDGYEVMIDQKWHKVPDSAILEKKVRPEGVFGAMVWIIPGTREAGNPQIRCFLPGTEI